MEHAFVLYELYHEDLFVDKVSTYCDRVTNKEISYVSTIGFFSTLDELQDILSYHSEWVDDKKWTNPYFKDIDELISWSENKFKELISCK